MTNAFVTLAAQLGRSAAWVGSQIGHADMTTMQRYHHQASATELQPRIRQKVEFLLGDTADLGDP